MHDLITFLATFTFGLSQAAAQTAEFSGPLHPTLSECAPGDPALRLPDLRPDAPSSVRTTRKGSNRIIEFTSKIGNYGDGPLLLEGRTFSTEAGLFQQIFQLIDREDGSRCARLTGTFASDPTQRHLQFRPGIVGFELRSGDPDTGELVARGSKTGVCLLDLERIKGFDAGSHPPLGIPTCEDLDGVQGVAVGWKDVYNRTVPGQFIDLDVSDSVPVGSYFLVNHLDPYDFIWETDKSNNRSFTPAMVNQRAVGDRGPPRVTRPDQQRPSRPGVLPPAPAPRVQSTPRPRPVATRRPRPRPTRPVRTLSRSR